jgi:CheY-like chemotaxis protein
VKNSIKRNIWTVPAFVSGKLLETGEIQVHDKKCQWNGNMRDARRANTQMAPESGAEPKALILAVEQDRHVRTLQRYFLEQAGYRIEFCNNGKEALDRIRSLHPDIVISEILVPQLDGLSVCRAIKADPALRDVVVLMLSILTAEERALEAGANAFLKKPLNDSVLVQSIERLLAQRAPRKPHGSD